MRIKNIQMGILFFIFSFSSFYMYAGTMRNITSMDFEYRSNGIWIITLEDAFILDLNQTLTLLIKPVTRFYPELLTGDLESGLVYLWSKGVYSQFSYTLGLPLTPLISEWSQTLHSVYADFTMEREKDFLTTALKATLRRDGYWLNHSIGYSYRFDILELWIRNSLSYDSLILWMDSIWGETRWHLDERWTLKGGTTVGTFKSEASSQLSGIEFSINTGFTMRIATSKWGYQFSYIMNPDYTSQKHLLVVDIQL